MDEFEVIKLLLVAAVLGGIVGYERERAHKMAGIRTHALVALGAALLTILSVHGFNDAPQVAQYDPGRIISNIIVGIGFIGGGAILRKNSHVIGITTAATLWSVAGIGIAVGLGYVYIAFAAAVIAYLILTFVWLMERRINSSAHYKASIEQIHKGNGHSESVHEDGEA